MTTKWERNSKDFGRKMMEKQGYKEGTGFGEGRRVPVQAEQRPRNMGLGYDERRKPLTTNSFALLEEEEESGIPLQDRPPIVQPQSKPSIIYNIESVKSDDRHKETTTVIQKDETAGWVFLSNRHPPINCSVLDRLKKEREASAIPISDINDLDDMESQFGKQKNELELLIDEEEEYNVHIGIDAF
jgi:hypothetical protein